MDSGAVADRRCHWLRLAGLDELDDLGAKERQVWIRA